MLLYIYIEGHEVKKVKNLILFKYYGNKFWKMISIFQKFVLKINFYINRILNYYLN